MNTIGGLTRDVTKEPEVKPSNLVMDEQSLNRFPMVGPLVGWVLSHIIQEYSHWLVDVVGVGTWSLLKVHSHLVLCTLVLSPLTPS